MARQCRPNFNPSRERKAQIDALVEITGAETGGWRKK